MKFEPPNLTSQQIQATTTKLAKPNPPPPTDRNKTTHLHYTNHSNPHVGEGKKKKKKTAAQPPIATHNPSHHHVLATQQKSTNPALKQRLESRKPTQHYKTQISNPRSKKVKPNLSQWVTY